jgi:hypothetical protein
MIKSNGEAWVSQEGTVDQNGTGAKYRSGTFAMYRSVCVVCKTDRRILKRALIHACFRGTRRVAKVKKAPMEQALGN